MYSQMCMFYGSAAATRESESRNSVASSRYKISEGAVSPRACADKDASTQSSTAVRSGGAKNSERLPPRVSRSHRRFETVFAKHSHRPHTAHTAPPRPHSATAHHLVGCRATSTGPSQASAPKSEEDGPGTNIGHTGPFRRFSLPQASDEDPARTAVCPPAPHSAKCRVFSSSASTAAKSPASPTGAEDPTLKAWGAVFGLTTSERSQRPFEGLRVMNERPHVATVGAGAPARLRLPLALVVLLAALPVANGACGEVEACSGMSPGQQALISAHMARSPPKGQTRSADFTKDTCAHVLVGRALSYTPTKNCEATPAAKLKKQIERTCVADAITLFVHAPLCQTKAQYTTTQLVWFYLTAVATTSTLTEWLRYPLSPI